MRAGQRKLRITVVAEQRGLPLENVVAPGAIGPAARTGKLASVDVLVASGALPGRRAKHDVADGTTGILEAMAGPAFHSAVGAC